MIHSLFSILQVLSGHAALVDVRERGIGKWAEGQIAAEWHTLVRDYHFYRRGIVRRSVSGGPG